VVGRLCEGGLAGRVSCPSACLPLLRYLKYRRSLIAPTEKKPETNGEHTFARRRPGETLLWRLRRVRGSTETRELRLPGVPASRAPSFAEKLGEKQRKRKARRFPRCQGMASSP